MVQTNTSRVSSLSAPSGPSGAELETSTTTIDDLLKFCQKVLDILTNWEHYDPNQPINSAIRLHTYDSS